MGEGYVGTMSQDPIALWRGVVVRVCDLALSLSDQEAQRYVPACPDWTVRDLLAHMIGLGADTADGNEPDDHDEAWTQAQVDRRAGVPLAALVEEWQALVPRLSAYMTEHGPRPLNDAVIHEQDLRGAVDRPGARETTELAIVRDTLLERIAGRVGDLPPIALCGTELEWVSRGSVEDAETVLEASDFDLARAAMCRRTPAELREWTVRGDVEAYLDALAHLGPLPEARLVEP
ncbi:hypothetical protein GCM10011519_28500 [Marmoricola endophyticus]|uniref:Mycothiol-dependent maleylpyruvate isomerase metal-binding domain-containing protein n=1 Tax=Marmoricola endophyticus TaxID=2040280 RepID=A0A917BPI7_9ACTN|nr:maleylpyruvate isomerase N-terminal domain-containing protein [Marmoricola endophyticus]GGF52844.1 hypothetical protein GCM10011519_28500 [Marmoricola endophyticus]